MAKNYTQYYRLCQWEPEDKFMRTEFNQDNQRLESALRGLETSKAKQSEVTELRQAVNQRGRVAAGSYLGTGTPSLHVDVGFHPLAVLVETTSGQRHSSGNSGSIGGLALRGAALANRGGPLVAVDETGFSAYNRGEFSGSFNQNGGIYFYVAWG